MAFPTETVYGLGADGLNPNALCKIFEAKNRPSDNPIILHFESVGAIRNLFSSLPQNFDLVTSSFCPGPITMVLPRPKSIPPEVSAGLDTVAVRVPGNQLARELIQVVGGPIAAPSANESGSPSATTAQHVLDDLDGKIAGVIDGGSCEVGVESTVVDITNETVRVLRPGGVSLEQLADVLGYEPEIVSDVASGSPGVRHDHYQPKCQVILYTGFPPRITEDDGIISLTYDPPRAKYSVRMKNLDEYARRLYDAMREADNEKISRLFMEKPMNVGIGRALLDRLFRASGQTLVK